MFVRQIFHFFENKLMCCFVQNLPLKALTIYDHLKQTTQIIRDEIIYLVAANAAGKLGLLSRARSIHEDIVSSGISYETNVKIVNTL